MLIGERYFFYIEDFFIFNVQSGFVLLVVKVVVIDIDVKVNVVFVCFVYWYGECIVCVYYVGFCIFVNLQFCCVILLQFQWVVVYMVFSYVEDGCCYCLQVGGGFQLEVGEFQYIQFLIGVQQYQCWQVDIVVYVDVNFSGFCYFVYQGSNSVFVVRIGNGDNWCLCFVVEQFDIVNDFYVSVGCCVE